MNSFFQGPILFNTYFSLSVSVAGLQINLVAKKVSKVMDAINEDLGLFSKWCKTPCQGYIYPSPKILLVKTTYGLKIIFWTKMQN